MPKQSLVEELDALLAAISSGSPEADILKAAFIARLVDIDASRANMAKGRLKDGEGRRRRYMQALEAYMKDKLPEDWRDKGWMALADLKDPSHAELMKYWPSGVPEPQLSNTQDFFKQFGEYLVRGGYMPGLGPDEPED